MSLPPRNVCTIQPRICIYPNEFNQDTSFDGAWAAATQVEAEMCSVQ